MLSKPDDSWIPLSQLAKEYSVSTDLVRLWLERRGWVLYGNPSGGVRRYGYCLEKHAAAFREYRDQDISGYVSLVGLAKECNVRQEALHTWIRGLHGRTRSLHTVKMGARWYFSPWLAAEYKNGRAKFNRNIPTRREKRPKGWVKVRGLTDEVGRGWLYNYISESGIRTVSDRKTLYISPEDAEVVRLAYRSDFPTPGWVQMTEAAESCGVTYDAIKYWVDKHEIPIRRYRNERNGQRAWYLLERDADAYRAEREERRAA